MYVTECIFYAVVLNDFLFKVLIIFKIKLHTYLSKIYFFYIFQFLQQRKLFIYR